MMPKITVIVANYNNGAYLGDCLRSIASQSFKDFECIIVDDGSTDESCKIIRAVTRRDKRFILVIQENHGASAARNRALEMATGDYVAFLDSDDCFCPDALQLMYNLAVQNNADIVGGGGVRVADDFSWMDTPPQNFINPPFTIYSHSVGDLIRMSQLGDSYRFVWVWRRLFRRDTIADIRFDENLFPGEDTCFIMEIIPRACRIIETQAMVVYHRVARTSISLAAFNQKYFSYIVPTLRRLRKIMDAYYPASFQRFFYKLYMDLVMQETIVKSMKTGRLMHQVADHLRPIYGTPILPTHYLPWPRRIIFWIFMKVF